jgi:hypothetical protein
VGEVRKVCSNLAGKSEGRRLFVRPRLRWNYDIKTNLREIGLELMEQIRLAVFGPVASFCEHGDETSGSIKGEGVRYGAGAASMLYHLM